MLKILQARLQQYLNHELRDVQAGFRKGRGTRNQIANIYWIMENHESSRKTYISALLTMPKPWLCVDHNKLWKILKEMGLPDHLTCLSRNLYADQEATVRTGHGTTDWFQIGKGVRQGCILSPCLFNLYAEYIMRCTIFLGSHLSLIWISTLNSDSCYSSLDDVVSYKVINTI